ncbi:MAG TPA: hypothetical protein PL070_18860 [Flavobacteriales bacterium]|nr:hypothetical protein [Flavobacteriales bacterium]
MWTYTRAATCYAILLAFGSEAKSQADGLVAYVPDKPIERTADDTRIAIVQGAVAGKIEAIVPDGAERVDILTARGRVKHSYSTAEFERIGLGHLRPGTWTLRVHRAGTMSIRRFVVMERGAVVWWPSGPVRKR